MTATGRGAQVVLTGVAQAAARGSAATTAAGNRLIMDNLILAGSVADGTTDDASTRSGSTPDWASGTALAPTLVLNFADDGTLDSRITFTRASSATYFDVTGAIQTASTNVARFDYDPVTHAARGLQIEEARTNLLLNSATLSTQSVTVTATPYTLSFYGTGTVTLTGTSTAGPLVGTGAFPSRVTLTFTPTAGSLTCTVTGSVLNAQIEAGSFATSWIPTTGATATRAADITAMAWSPAYPFTLVGDATVSVLAPAAAEGVAVLTDGTTANRIAIRANSSASNAFGGLYVVATANTAVAQSVNTITASVPFKVGAVATTTAMTLCGNGGALVTAAGAAPAGLTTLTLGQTNTPANALNGWVRRLRYWPRAMGNDELQGITR